MFDQNDPNQPTTDAAATPVVDPAQPSADPMQASPSPVQPGYGDPQSSDQTMQPAPADPMPAPSAPAMDTPEAPASADMTSDAPVFNTTSLPALEDASTPTSAPDMTAPVTSDPMPTEAAEPADMAEPVTPSFSDTPVATDPAPVTDGNGSDLLGLKQQALQSLSPLLSHLDQTPEEKFRTTMMMIQASDDQSLVQAAYDAANAIPDEKAKAQALLDVVNEINYFTQAKPGTQTPSVT